MNQKTDARVLLGGQVTGFKGKYPGLLEEALLAIRSGKPLYLIGGFGGCTASIIEALNGGTPDVLTDAYQAREPLNQAVADHYRIDAADGKTSPLDYGEEVRSLQTTGVTGLNNGLSPDENAILFASRNLPEIVHYLLKGLATRLV
jgi:hypothetical protein